MRRLRLPAKLRIVVKEWVCEFLIVGTMVIEADRRMKARERIYAASRRPWLLRYERRLINLRIVGNAYGNEYDKAA